ncbi:DUF421 domain-containing protein [Myroides odoratimimus]|uniref:YetF C-terminal domain-containing protein n=2 Tax=Myroides odoratimimus TaxID=76832 RepID=A0A0S7E633_9FLAO|nr:MULTISPECIES: YetF domain-containing protein [Myroides]OJR80721.1 hypothetical protein BK387_29895 [Escherichia coli]AJA68476.1 Protein of unknown function DUF421 [Myroides sp. A21]ALU25754.1 hypothetical protein AS202_06230 [Myroides odoratimimus]EHO10673.1 hypothetical protein HMPREF9712_01021 [Myroides odoratimimus CCUG 10230]EHO14861.1 hypothetical protein HMPREF9714_00258 [Myroides odoratimimus CCUG 12901]
MEYLDIVWRSVAVYLFMIIAMRVFGKKQLSQLNTFDVVLMLLISNSVQNAMVGPNTSLEGGILAAFVLFSLNYGMKRLIAHNKLVNRLLQQKPEVIIQHGVVDFAKATQLSITSEELTEAMHEHGVEYFKQVKLATLEINGSISIIAKDNEGQYKETFHKRKEKHQTV